MPNRRKIGANAFLRKAEEAYKHKGFRENWLTDSGAYTDGQKTVAYLL